jgi:glycosyltransferase involved in cell wall biosynthesis
MVRPGRMTAPARHILHVFPTFAVGGYAVRFAKLANSFGRRYRHSIVALDGNQAAKQLLDAALALDFIPPPDVKGDTLGNLRRVRRALRQFRPDLVCTYNWGAIEWALANRFLPLVRSLHVEDGFGPEEAGGQIRRRVLTRRLALGRSQVLIPSLTLKRLALEVWRLDPKRVLYVPNGIAIERFIVRQTDHRPLAIGTLATLREEKNIPRLMRAFARLPREFDAELLVIGGGPLLEPLKAEATRIDPRIRFLGPTADPAAALHTLDMFALSSDTEQMPLSILEAMAAGLPIVSTDVGDVRNMLPAVSQTWVMPKGDDEGFADALARLARDAEARRTLGRANRLHVAATYDEATMLAAWDRLFAGE